MYRPVQKVVSNEKKTKTKEVNFEAKESEKKIKIKTVAKLNV